MYANKMNQRSVVFNTDPSVTRNFEQEMQRVMNRS